MENLFILSYHYRFYFTQIKTNLISLSLSVEQYRYYCRHFLLGNSFAKLGRRALGTRKLGINEAFLAVPKEHGNRYLPSFCRLQENFSFSLDMNVPERKADVAWSIVMAKFNKIGTARD